MKVHIILHESFEALGAIETWVKIRSYEVSFTCLYDRQMFPKTIDFDFLIVMGGPQSPATTLEECPYFDSKKEIDFIKQAIDANKIVFGVCLGAQMIGESLGAKFEHSPNREIGMFPIVLTDDGKKDPIISQFPEVFSVGHWHRDMPGLTSDSKILAESEGCPRQIVKYSPKIYGFQCHFEFTLDTIDGMIQNCGYELEKHRSLAFVEKENELRSHDYTQINHFLYKFLDQLTQSS